MTECPIQKIRCDGCGSGFPHQPGTLPTPDARKAYCSSCVSTLKNYEMMLVASSKVYPVVIAVAIPAGKTKRHLLMRIQEGYELFEKMDTWTRLTRIIDKKQDHY